MLANFQPSSSPMLCSFDRGNIAGLQKTQGMQMPMGPRLLWARNNGLK